MWFVAFLQHLQDTSQYVKSELNAVEREQKQIDERAGQVEWELRHIMDKGYQQWLYLNQFILYMIRVLFNSIQGCVQKIPIWIIHLFSMNNGNCKYPISFY